MLARIPSRLLSEWMAYDRLDPIGNTRGDLQAALIAATIANVTRDPKRRRRPFTLEDFLLRFEPKARPTAEQLKRRVELLNAAFGGRDLRRKR